MQRLAAMAISMSLFLVGCGQPQQGGGGQPGAQSGAPYGGQEETQVAQKCPSCGAELVDGKCPT